MSKKIAYIAIGVISQVLSACSNTEDAPYLQQTHDASDKLTRSSVDFSSDSVSTLYFNSPEEYEHALSHIRSLDSDMEKSQWMHDTYPEFTSIHDVYELAGEEAAVADLETEEQFNSFMDKYSCLFFPLEEEDAGFYIPIKDTDLSYLANLNCIIIIGDNVIDLKDINDYSDLQECGRAFYELPSPMTLASEESFRITGRSMNSVGPEYDSDWKVYDKEKRKVKLKARRLLKEKKLSPDVAFSESYFHTEFCFRKKTWIGWINYSCKSAINGVVNIPGYSKLYLNSNSSGTSSHDKEYPYPIHISNDANYRYYRYYAAPCEVVVNFDDISTPLQYSWTMTGIVFKTPLNGVLPEVYPYYP